MSWVTSVNFILLCVIDSSRRSEQASANRIAVIGGGIGGTTAALFLREELGDGVDIALYEKNKKIGGRLATVEIGGRFYEAGGSVIHPRNEIMANLTESLGLNRSSGIDMTFGLYDGNKIAFQTYRYRFFSSFVNALRLLWRYGFDLLNLDPWIDGVINWYVKIYSAQKLKTSFASVYEMFHTMSSLFDDLIGSTIGDYLIELGFGRRFNNELARVAMRTNYGQDLNIHGFVGAISLAGAQGGLWSVKDGNYLVAEGALRQSKARWMEREVTRVVESKSGEKTFRLISVDSSGMQSEEDFDAVVLAVPCTVRGCGGIEFSVKGIDAKLIKFPKTYHRTVANFVKGKLDTKRFFGVDGDNFPDCLYSVAEEDLLFMSLCRQVPVDYGYNPDDPQLISDFNVYKIFTQAPLTKHHVDRLFKSNTDFVAIDWLAYPEYDEIPKDIESSLPSFILDSEGGLISVNAIESSASAMEQSTIGAKNAALLVAKFLRK